MQEDLANPERHPGKQSSSQKSHVELAPQQSTKLLGRVTAWCFKAVVQEREAE